VDDGNGLSPLIDFLTAGADSVPVEENLKGSVAQATASDDDPGHHAFTERMVGRWQNRGFLMAPSVTRALQAIKRYGAQPEQIDQAILAAINVTLCLASGGSDRVAEGFNSDIASSGRAARTVAVRLATFAGAMV
jgi:hypothetical protein